MRGHLKFLALAAALSALLVIALPAAALTGGEIDGDLHPNVGLLLVDGSPACSGTLVSPTVFVTAGHCGSGGRVAVTFNSDLGGDLELFEGTLHVDPQFNFAADDPHDLAVVVLDEAAPVAPSSLPTAGLLEGVEKKTLLTSVGYGVSGSKKALRFDGARRFGTLELSKLYPAQAVVTPVTAAHCFGDSGGPMLLGDTVVAVTSGGKATCKGKSGVYRLDTAGARAFLDDFVALP